MAVDPALATMQRFLAALDRYDLETVVSCFSEDVEYHHHPYSEAGHELHPEDHDWHLARGHDELRELLKWRGDDVIVHHITAFARNGSHCFNEGYATTKGSDVITGTWLSIFEVDEKDRIARYISYVADPPLPIIGHIDTVQSVG